MFCLLRKVLPIKNDNLNIIIIEIRHLLANGRTCICRIANHESLTLNHYGISIDIGVEMDGSSKMSGIIYKSDIETKQIPNKT